MKSWKFGLNILAVVAVVLMIVAMFLPWWSLGLQGLMQTDIYPYLIDGPGSELVGYRRSPQMRLLTGVLVFSILLTFLGSFIKGKWSRISLIVGGALALLGTWRLLARVAGVAARFHIPIQGEGRAIYEGFAQIEVWTKLQLGTYMIIAGAILAILAAVLHKYVRMGD